MIQWLKYFLVGIEQTSALAVKTLSALLVLKETIDRDIHTTFGRRSNSALKLMDELFRNPVTTVEKAAVICNLSFKAANDLIGLLNRKLYLKELTGQSRNRIFVFEPYLLIFNDQ
jgi:Fic family protein